MRIPGPAVAAGVVVAVLGIAGLARGAVPQSGSSTTRNMSSQPIVVSGAYVHPPVPPTDTAAAYFTVDNTTSQADTLQSVETGASPVAVLHTTMAGGSMAMATDGVRVPAHGTLRFAPGGNHVMIEKVYGTLRVGQTVNLELDFADAGSIDVTAPVVPLGTDSPTTDSPTAGSPTTPAGGHS